MPYAVTLVAGVQSSSRRGIAFLESDTDQDVNAKQVLDGLKPKAKNDVRSRFDHWLSGGICKKYFHGWDDENQGCFVFKWKEGRQHHRLYGFLCHPRYEEREGYVRDPAFEVCVLALHGEKEDFNTDPEVFRTLKRLSRNPEVMGRVVRAFEIEDKTKEKKKRSR